MSLFDVRLKKLGTALDGKISVSPDCGRPLDQFALSDQLVLAVDAPVHVRVVAAGGTVVVIVVVDDVVEVLVEVEVDVLVEVEVELLVDDAVEDVVEVDVDDVGNVHPAVDIRLSST